MIKVVVKHSYADKFDYRCVWDGPEISGKSRQPLLDACRALKRAGADTTQKCGLFHEGSEVASMTVDLGYGATLTVEDGDGPPRFRKFREFSMEVEDGD